MPRLGVTPKGENPILMFRVQEKTLAMLKRYADKRGVSVSEFARECIEGFIGVSTGSEDAQRNKKSGK